MHREVHARERSARSAVSILESLRQRTKIMEEQTAILTFNRNYCNGEDDLRDHAEFPR